MAELSYLKLKNDTSGEEIPGDVLEKAYDKHIEVVAFSQETTRPTHPQTGQVTGETAYGALKIVKPIDQASPMLQKGMADGNKFSGDILFVKTDNDGKRKHWYTIGIANASIVGIKMYKPPVMSESESKYPDLEEILFRFVKITWRHVLKSKEATADWSAR